MRRDPRTDPPKEVPKKYAPELPGGLGSLKTQPEWTMVGVRGRIRAWTKSEARAAFKQQLGLDRLPVGAKVTKI